MAGNLVSLEVVNFKEEIKRIEQEVERLAKAGVHERMDFATSQLRVVTPVDTGEARSGWRSRKFIDGGTTAGIIENPVEHIVYLNNGHSKQAPQYFIEQVLLTIGLITPY